MYSSHVLAKGIVLKEKYRIDEVIGEGGFGIVYKATDLLINDTVAIKEFFPSTLGTRVGADGNDHSISVISPDRQQSYDKALERFREEASKLAKFNKEDGIVSVKNYFEANNTGYIVMEYIKGITLEQYIEEAGGKIPWEKAVAMLVPIMDSLERIHKDGLIHRDISPDNIMITDEGGAKLIDFGASRNFDMEEQEFTVIVRNGYAPIEQYLSDSDQKPALDVYALSATLYRMITGETPVNSGQRANESINRVKLTNVPEYTEKVLNKGMALNEDDRYESVNDLKKALLRHKSLRLWPWVFLVNVAVVCFGVFTFLNFNAESVIPSVSVELLENTEKESVNEYPTDAEKSTDETYTEKSLGDYFVVSYDVIREDPKEEGIALLCVNPGDIVSALNNTGDYTLVTTDGGISGYILTKSLETESDYMLLNELHAKILEASGGEALSDIGDKNCVFDDFDGDGDKELYMTVYTGKTGFWYADSDNVLRLDTKVPKLVTALRQGRDIIVQTKNQLSTKDQFVYYVLYEGKPTKLDTGDYYIGESNRGLSAVINYQIATSNPVKYGTKVEYIDRSGNLKRYISWDWDGSATPVVIVNGKIGECASCRISLSDFKKIPEADKILKETRDNIVTTEWLMFSFIATEEGDVNHTVSGKPLDATVDSIYYNEQGFFIINYLVSTQMYPEFAPFDMSKMYFHYIIPYAADGKLIEEEYFNQGTQTRGYKEGRVTEASGNWPILVRSDFSNYRMP